MLRLTRARYAPNLKAVVEAERPPSEHYISSARAAYLKPKRGDDKSFPSESYGIELEKNQSPIGRATGNATRDLEIAKEFGVNKITAEAKGGGVLEIGFGPAE